MISGRDNVENRASCRLSGPPNEAIISSVRLEMEEIKKENEVWREAEIVLKAAQTLSRDEPHPLNAAKAKSVLLRLLLGRDELDEFAAKRKEYSWRKNLN